MGGLCGKPPQKTTLAVEKKQGLAVPVKTDARKIPNISVAENAPVNQVELKKHNSQAIENEKAIRDAADKKEAEERAAAQADYDRECIEITKLCKYLMDAKIKTLVVQKNLEVAMKKAEEEEARKKAEEAVRKLEEDRLAALKALNDYQKNMVFDHPTEVATKIGQNFTQLKEFSRTAVLCVLNCTDAKLEMTHMKMSKGQHKYATDNTILPQKYQHYTFHNLLLTGVCAELQFTHPKKIFRISFINPFLGNKAAFTEETDAAKPFDMKTSVSGRLANKDVQSQVSTSFSTKFKHERYPPIYTVVIENC